MLVEKVERNGLVAKMFSTKIGFYYKIYFKRKMVSCSYTYLSDINLCRDRMLDVLDTFDGYDINRLLKNVRNNAFKE